MQAVRIGSNVGAIILIALVVGLIVKICLGLVVGNIAKKKGYGFAGFFILGMFFFIIGLIVSLCLDDKNVQISTITGAFSHAKTSGSDELLQLKKLLDENVITEQEFEAKKKQILGL